MPLIVVTSLKGGAGKTTLAANLAVGLHSVGWSVTAIDFNPQDALKLHFGVDVHDRRGFAAHMLAGDRGWQETVVNTESGVDVVPFGRVGAMLSGAVSGFVADDVDSVLVELTALAASRIVVVDAPSLPSTSARRLAKAADVVIVVTSTDASSYAALSLADSELFLADDGILGKTLLVANQFDQGARLQRSVLALLNQTFGDKLAATVARDQIVDEALASRRTVLLHDRTSEAARSLVALAIRVDRLCSSNGDVN